MNCECFRTDSIEDMVSTIQDGMKMNLSMKDSQSSR